MQAYDIRVIIYLVNKLIGCVGEQVVKKNGIYQIFKRMCDILISFVGIVISIPFIILIKILYILTGDFNSIFYVQKRIGKNGKIFNMYKFRSMYPDADIRLKELLKNKKYKQEWEANQKLDHDPRITKVGKIIRKTSIDEMLQFINVFKGDMSIIGPRPLVPGELDKHNGNHKIYESVRPGITGNWACHGRSATTYEKRLELEYFYAENISFLLDFKLFFLTFFIIFQHERVK